MIVQWLPDFAPFQGSGVDIGGRFRGAQWFDRGRLVLPVWLSWSNDGTLVIIRGTNHHSRFCKPPQKDAGQCPMV